MRLYAHIQRMLYRVLDAEARDSALERGGNLVLGAFIVLNVLAVILETVEPIRDRAGGLFAGFESVSVAVFSVEYVLRVWSCVQNQRFARPVVGRLQFVLSPLAVVDLVAILPALLPGDMLLDLRFVRIIRLVRILRVLKIARYSRTVRTFANVAHTRRTDLALIGLFLLLLLVVSSSLMYFAEHATQPQAFSSIPAAMWWAVATLTTVGYGDIYPVTPFGKFLGSIIALLGIGFFALPAGILAAAFAEELHRARGGARTCPHCGKEIA